MKTASMVLGFAASGLSILLNGSIIVTPAYLNELVLDFVHLLPLLAVIGSILGIVAAIFVKRKRILSGVLFIFAALLNIQIPMLVSFILAAIFALMKNKASDVEVSA